MGRDRLDPLVNRPFPSPDGIAWTSLRRLYDWVLGWARTPYGLVALVTLSVAEASFFPVPPDPLLIAMCLGVPAAAFRFAAWTTAASVVGGVVGYAMGFTAWTLLSAFFFRWVPGVTPEAFASVQILYERYDFWTIFLAGLTPVPYKVFTLSAGVFALDFPVFVLASFCSRGLRFFAVAALVWKFGAPVTAFVDRYFNVLTVVFGALLVLGFILVGVLL